MGFNLASVSHFKCESVFLSKYYNLSMKKSIVLLTLFVISNLSAQQRPKLVVGIVVDQMKMEYLYRFSDDFSPNGFKKLMNNGYTFQNMHYNYMPTYTAPDMLQFIQERHQLHMELLVTNGLAEQLEKKCIVQMMLG